MKILRKTEDDPKNKGNAINEDGLKIKIAPKIKTTKKMKTNAKN